MATLVLNKQGEYETMWVSPAEVFTHLDNMFRPDAWKSLAVGIDRRTEVWHQTIVDMEVVFTVDTSDVVNKVRIVIRQANVVLVQAEFIGLDAIGYASVIAELINNAKGY